MKDELYYMQDARQYVGNSMSWWAKDYHGYVCDIKKAHIFTLEEAKKASLRNTDILWPKDYIDQRIQHHIDMQSCEKNLAKVISCESFTNNSNIL